MPSHGGRLRNANLTPAYRQGLRVASVWLFDLACSLGARLTRKTPAPVIDRVLERCIDVAYQNGEKLYFVRLGLIGLQRAWHLSGPLLRGSWAAIRGWRVLQPVRSRVPMSKLILKALLLTLLASGHGCVGYARECQWAAMMAAWLSFEALLRPGETEALRVSDLVFPDGIPGEDSQEGLVVTIRKPKTRRLWQMQFVLVNDVALILWLRWWVAGASRNRLLFRVGRRKWSNLFSAGLARLGLQDRHFTLGSLRSGGATYHFRTYQNLATLQYLGRWARADTLRYYLHEALTVKVEAESTSEAKAQLEYVMQHVALLQHPPPRSLQSLVRARP